MEVLALIRQVAQEGKQETETKMGWPDRKKLGSVWEGQDKKVRTEWVRKEGKRHTHLGLAKCFVRNRLAANRTQGTRAIMFAYPEPMQEKVTPIRRSRFSCPF